MSRASPSCHVVVDAKELMTDALSVLASLRLTATIDIGVGVGTDSGGGGGGAAERNPFQRALEAPHGIPVVVLSAFEPTIDQAIACGNRNRSGGAFVIAACLGARGRPSSLAPELGMPMLEDVASAIACALLVGTMGSLRAEVSARALGPADKARLRHAADKGERLVRLDDGLVGLVRADGSTPLGRIDDVDRALAALGRTYRGDRPSLPRVEGADRRAALDVLMGPARTLSDPASKAALEPYDLPLPVEEMCATASRASSESARIGYPVRVALASPELRSSEHSDLVVEGVESSARVRETFRELVALAERKDPRARVLGVTVSASTVARCTLAASVERIAPTRLAARLGFADPHGRATDDSVELVLPASPEDVRRSILGLRGASLLSHAADADAGAVVSGLTDVVLRIAAFLDDFPDEVSHVALDPIAILVGGEVEIREARVRVTDAFSRQLG